MRPFDDSDEADRDQVRGLTDEAIERQLREVEAQGDAQAIEFLRLVRGLDIEQRRRIWRQIDTLNALNQGATHVSPRKLQ